MCKVTPLMLWEAFGNNPKEEFPTLAQSNMYAQAAEKVNEMLFGPPSKDEQTDDLQGIPQECP